MFKVTKLNKNSSFDFDDGHLKISSTDVEIDWKEDKLVKLIELSSIEDVDKLLKGSHNLRRIQIENSKIKSLDCLSNNLNIEYIDITYSGLQNLTHNITSINLTTLNLDRNNITDVSSLSSLVNLIHLDLSYNEIKNIDCLSSLLKLRHIDLKCNLVDNVEALILLPEIININVPKNKIVDISYFHKIRGDQHIDIENNDIDLTTISLYKLCDSFIWTSLTNRVRYTTSKFVRYHNYRNRIRKSLERQTFVCSKILHHWFLFFYQSLDIHLCNRFSFLSYYST